MEMGGSHKKDNILVVINIFHFYKISLLDHDRLGLINVFEAHRPAYTLHIMLLDDH